MFLQDLGQQGAGRFLVIIFGPAFCLNTVADRLPQQGVGLLFANQRQQVPRAIREHHAMDLGVVFHRLEKLVEPLFRGLLDNRGKGFFGALDVLVEDLFV